MPAKTGTHQFLHNVDLHIPAKVMVAIMGPSGCGKSTLMNVLSGRAHYGYHTGIGGDTAECMLWIVGGQMLKGW